MMTDTVIFANAKGKRKQLLKLRNGHPVVRGSKNVFLSLRDRNTLSWAGDCDPLAEREG